MQKFYGNLRNNSVSRDNNVYKGRYVVDSQFTKNELPLIAEDFIKLTIDRTKSPKTIIVARHGKPALNRKLWISSEDYVDWWAQYDAGGLIPNQKIPRNLLNAIANSEIIISSPLRRVVETAQSVAGGKEFQTNEIFVEAPLPPPQLPNWFKLTPRMWGFVARCVWFIGFSRGQESHDEAKIRAQNAAKELIDLSQKHGTVALLAHGWFNRMMRPYLKENGYECSYDGGDFHWSYRVYTKRD